MDKKHFFTSSSPCQAATAGDDEGDRLLFSAAGEGEFGGAGARAAGLQEGENEAGAVPCMKKHTELAAREIILFSIIDSVNFLLFFYKALLGNTYFFHSRYS